MSKSHWSYALIAITALAAALNMPPAQAQWWDRTASKAGKPEGTELIIIGGKEAPVQIIGKDQPIECPEGFWQSNSRTIPFCVNRNHSTYRDTPLCLISDCRHIQLKSIHIPLRLNATSLEANWQHYANAVNVGKVEGKDLLSLGEVWPGVYGVSRPWGQVAQLLCEATQCHRPAIEIPLLKQLVASLNFGGLGTQPSLPLMADLLSSKQPARLAHLPAHWFANQPLTKILDQFQLWEQTADQLGISQPTTGQAGLEYGQFHIVQSVGLHGKMQFFYDNRLPSDQANVEQGQGRTEIITGSNRFVKNRCIVKSGAGRAYNNCARIIVRQNAAVPDQGTYQTFALITAHEEKLTGLGGGDVILANTSLMNFDFHSGDFRTPEIVGGTNDDPIIPTGAPKEVGVPLDQCNPTPFRMLPLLEAPAIIVPAYENPSSHCPNVFRTSGATYRKQIFLFSQNGEDHLEGFVPRTCEQRQLYRIVRTNKGDRAVRDMVISACKGIPEAGNVQGKRLTGQNVIQVFLRGNLLAKPQ